MTNENLQIDEGKERKAGWLELFFDLVYVVIISKIVHELSHLHDGHLQHNLFLNYLIILVPVWWLWTGHTMYVNRFGIDDKLEKILTFVQMFLIIVLSMFVGAGDLQTTHLYYVSVYFLIRICTVLLYLRGSVLYPENKKTALIIAKIITGGALISLSGLFFLKTHLQVGVALLYVGILFDIVVLYLSQKKYAFTTFFKELLIERYGLLAIIILGESVVNLSRSLGEIHWNLNIALNGILGFLLLVSVWWSYFGITGYVSDRKFIAPNIIYGHLFIYAALGFVATIIQFTITQDIIMKDFKILVISTMLSLLIGFFIVSISSVEKKLQYFAKKVAILAAIIAVVLLFNSYFLIIFSTTSIFIYGTYTFSKSMRGVKYNFGD